MNIKNALIVSLGLNCLLLAGAAHFFLKHNRPAPAAEKSSAPPAAGKNAPGKTAVSKSEPRTVMAPETTFDWRSVESEDYKKYIANLRAIGCPEETIRDIITADVNKLFESRKQARKKPAKRFEYWKGGNPFAGLMDEDALKLNQELAREKRALLKELLGIEPEEKPDLAAMLNPFEAMLDFLPAAKQSRLLELEQEFGAKLMKNINGTPDAEDMKAMRKIQAEKEAELLKILSPEEKEEYDLRMSETAMMMRMQLAGFEPTEQEFREVFKLRKKLDDEFGAFGSPANGKEEREKRKLAEKQINDQVKQVLGNDRYAEYERAQDHSYQTIAKAVERQGLAKESAVKVYEMKTAAEEQADRLRKDKSLPKDKRQEALRAIREETQKAISEVMGPDGFKSFQQQPGASWLRRISPDNPER